MALAISLFVLYKLLPPPFGDEGSDVAKVQLSVNAAYSEPHFSIMIIDDVAFSLLLFSFEHRLCLYSVCFLAIC